MNQGERRETGGKSGRVARERNKEKESRRESFWFHKREREGGRRLMCFCLALLILIHML